MTVQRLSVWVMLGVLVWLLSFVPTVHSRTSVAQVGPQHEASRLMAAIHQRAYIKASNTDADDVFGYAVALDGDTLVIGAPVEASAGSGINGAQANNSAPGAGAVYVFVREQGQWSQQAYLKASNTDADDVFGWSVALDGNTLVVGALGEASAATGINGDQADNSAPDAGAAYVFVREQGQWSQQAYLKASNTDASDYFGFSVALDGDMLAIGAWGEDSAALGVAGSQTHNGASNAGAVYLFEREQGQWSQQAYVKASNTDEGDYFGGSMALDENTLVVGALGEASATSGVNGDQSDNSAEDAGAIYVFVRNPAGSPASWSQQAYLKASNTDERDYFGGSVTLDDTTLVIGAWGEASMATGVNGDQADNSAPNAGAAYVFGREQGQWSQQAYLKASNTETRDEFGRTVALAGATLVVGAWGESSLTTGINGDQVNNNAPDAGAVYVFGRTPAGSPATWSQQAYLKASNTDEADEFSRSVAIDANYIAVAAHSEDGAAMGINGDQLSNAASRSGAVYSFMVPSTIYLPMLRR